MNAISNKVCDGYHTDLSVTGFVRTDTWNVDSFREREDCHFEYHGFGTTTSDNRLEVLRVFKLYSLQIIFSNLCLIIPTTNSGM